MMAVDQLLSAALSWAMQWGYDNVLNAVAVISLSALAIGAFIALWRRN